MRYEISEFADSKDKELAHLAAEIAVHELGIQKPQLRSLRKTRIKFPLGRAIVDLPDGVTGVCIDDNTVARVAISNDRLSRRDIIRVTFHEVRHAWQNRLAAWATKSSEQRERDAENFARELCFRIGIFSGDLEAKLFSYYCQNQKRR